MEPLSRIAHLANYAHTTAFSALPEAPTVESRAPRHQLSATRLRLANVLYRAAGAVEPKRTAAPAYPCAS